MGPKKLQPRIKKSLNLGMKAVREAKLAKRSSSFDEESSSPSELIESSTGETANELFQCSEPVAGPSRSSDERLMIMGVQDKDLNSNVGLLEHDYCVVASTSSRAVLDAGPHNYNVLETTPSPPKLIVESVSTEEEEHVQLRDVISGRRIVDIGFFFKSIFEMGVHGPMGCSIVNMRVVSETKAGLLSTFVLKCNMCDVERRICTQSPEESLDINTAVTLGAISIGIGYDQSNELISSMNIPFMSQGTFAKREEQLGGNIRQVSWDCLKEAGKEEARLAIELGEVDADNIPCITVITDGAWSKRSYHVNYNALSGVACIIGQRTGKVLFISVRNKYCALCSKYESERITIPVHKCYKNWTGPSTAMESDIILQGFKSSIEMHGLKYTQIVGDGDSSVYKTVTDAKPYGPTIIHKIECRNHLLRNFSKKIAELGVKTRSSINKPVALDLRRSIKSFAPRLRIAVKRATLYRIKQDTDVIDKIAALKDDLLNAPSHVFGQHEKCEEIAYFQCTRKGKEENLVPRMIECGVYQDIMRIMQRLVLNSSSLLHNMNNNDAEHYNSIVCKFVGGKRINHSQRGGYETRCNAAAISFNVGWDFHYMMHKSLTNRSPQRFTKKFIERKKQRKRQAQARKKVRNLRRARKQIIALADSHYGPEANPTFEPDMEPSKYSEKSEEFLRSLNTEPVALERNTRGQSTNALWIAERSKRLTASHFGEICRMREASAPKKVENILYRNFGGNKATQYEQSMSNLQ